MFALDLFNNDHERRLTEGSVDTLEQRRIDDLAMKMDDLVARAKTASTPEVKAALVKEFQKCKDERDSYYKIKDEGIGYGGLGEAGIGQDIANKTEKMARATPSTPASKVASTVKNAAKWLAGKGGPGKEGPTYEGLDQKKNSEKISDPKIDRLLTKAHREFPKARSSAEALAMKILNKEQNDVARLDRVNDREDRMIEKLANVEQNLQQQINQLKQTTEVDEGRMGEIDAMRQDLERMNERQFYTAYGMSKAAFQQKYRTLLNPALDEHGGGIGPRQRWQDLMQENKLSVGDPVVVTGPNEFEGKTGEIYEFSPSGTFVIVNLYNHGKHSMHLSDIKYNEYANQEQDEEDDWYDDEELNEFAPGPERDEDEVPDQILKLANRWWNATDDQPKITNVLRSLGWSIAQVESEDDAVQMQHDDGTTYFISADDFDPDVFEGFQDFNKVEPYAVCLAGKPVKKFDYYEQARKFHDNWKKKLYNQGEKEKADKITLMPLNLDETGKGTPVPAKEFARGVLKDLKKVNVKEEGRVDPILIKALNNMPDGLATHREVLDAAYDAYTMEVGKIHIKQNYGVTHAYIPKLMSLYKDKYGLTFNEAKADPAGSWIVYGGGKVMKFKTHSGAKAYAEKNGGKVASSEHYHDKIQKSGVDEAIVASGPSKPLDDRAVRKLVWDTMKINADTGDQAIQRALSVLAKKPQSRMVQDLQDKFQNLADRLSQGIAEGAMKDLHAELSDVYNRLAPSIERHRDSFKAGQLYDALEAVAEQHGAEAEFKRMMNGARNRAHMEYDTNPGGFHNWFWFLPFAEEELSEEQDTSGVERAILNRIMVAHTDLLIKFGPEKVMQAAEEVAYNVGDVDEIGTSDVSAYVHQVKQILGAV